VLVATLTPFCSCGTTAVLLGMMATTTPWAPLVAFMVSSPLTSPSELVFSAGLFGWPFALILFVGTMVLGVAAGLVAGVFDRLGLLQGQARMAGHVKDRPPDCGQAAGTADPVPTARGTDTLVALAAPAPPAAPATAAPATWAQRLRLAEFGRETVRVGYRLTLFFLGYTTLSYLLIELIPTSWVTDAVGQGSAWAVPFGALLGLPAYLNTEASLPMVAGLMDGGMGPGAAMAFIVTGAGTSIGAVTGLLVIARARVVTLAVSALFVGAIVLGYLAELLL
ncbi:MAG: permease, partial [Acidimicrobiia bacterium]|nr:permease [Acidimicrobiia bacterium]